MLQLPAEAVPRGQRSPRDGSEFCQKLRLAERQLLGKVDCLDLVDCLVVVIWGGSTEAWANTSSVFPFARLQGRGGLFHLFRQGMG